MTDDIDKILTLNEYERLERAIQTLDERVAKVQSDAKNASANTQAQLVQIGGILKCVDKIELLLYGNASTLGLKGEVMLNTRMREDVRRLTWLVVGEIVAVVVGGILVAINLAGG